MTSHIIIKIWGIFMGPAYNEIGGTFELTASSGADGGGISQLKDKLFKI